MFTHDNIDRIIGAKVIDVTGDKIGSVGQVFLDDRTNEPTWVTVNTGLFGTKETFIPLQGAQQNGDDLQVAYEKGLVKNAPNIDVDNGHLTPEEEAELYRYYGLGTGTAAQQANVAEVDRDGYAQGAAGQGVTDHDRNVAHGDIVSTAHEERLKVGTEEHEAGQARIRKYVTTEQQQVTEQETVQGEVAREHIEVEGENSDNDGQVRH